MFTVHKVKPFIQMLREQLGNPKRAAEIGVWRGSLSRQLFRCFPDLHLLMVDLYLKYDEKVMDRLSKMKQEAFYNALIHTLESTVKHVDRRTLLIGESTRVAGEIRDGSLDFVFIDADHQYKSCLADIKAWHPKVRKGGVVSGHDYNPLHKGVKRAVNEHCAETNNHVQLLPQCIWWFKND